MRMIELTDLTDGNDEPYAVVPADRVADTIREWYPLDEHVRPSDLEAIMELQEALLAEDFEEARHIAAEIAVGFEEVRPIADDGR